MFHGQASAVNRTKAYSPTWNTSTTFQRSTCLSAKYKPANTLSGRWNLNLKIAASTLMTMTTCSSFTVTRVTARWTWILTVFLSRWDTRLRRVSRSSCSVHFSRSRLKATRCIWNISLLIFTFLSMRKMKKLSSSLVLCAIRRIINCLFMRLNLQGRSLNHWGVISWRCFPLSSIRLMRFMLTRLTNIR